MLETAERDRDREMWKAERAVVLQILRDDHGRRWARVELERVIDDFEPAILDGALGRLRRDGVVLVEGAYVRASRATRRLDELELIGI